MCVMCRDRDNTHMSDRDITYTSQRQRHLTYLLSLICVMSLVYVMEIFNMCNMCHIERHVLCAETETSHISLIDRDITQISQRHRHDIYLI